MIKGLLGPDVGYIDILDHNTTKHLEKEAAGEGKKYTPIRPSASGKCTRELFYELMEFHGKAKYAKELKTPATHRLLNLGHSIESHILRQFELISEFFDIKYRQQVLSFAYLESKQDPKMSQWLEGSLDLVFWSDKYKCVADIKSKKDKWSAGYKSQWDETSDKLARMGSVQVISDQAYWVEDLEAFLLELNDPFFASNFLQLNLYANSSFLKERGVDHGAIIQYNKADSRLREVRFKPSRKLYEQTVGKFQNALDAAAVGDAAKAPQDYMLGSIKCAFCSYKKECWNDDALKAWFKTFPPKKWPTDTGKLGQAGRDIEALFRHYSQLSGAESQKQIVEREILKLLKDNNVGKLRLESGEVYEVRDLKTGIVLRRSKA
jgi:hypothetical protein